jgi:hypothetical protein
MIATMRASKDPASVPATMLLPFRTRAPAPERHFNRDRFRTDYRDI